MKRLIAFLGLLLVTLGVLVWRLPASLLASALPPLVAQHLKLHQVSGTIWNGSARLTTVYVPATLAQQWQCRPALSPLGLRCALDGALQGQAEFQLADRSLNLRQISGQWPLRVQAPGLLAEATPLRIDLQSARLSERWVAIDGHLVATQTLLHQGPQTTALGEVTLECRGDDGAGQSRCQLSNRGAEAVLNGQLSLQNQTINGQIELRPQANATPMQLRF